MAKIEILMPNMGESIFECTVLKWLVKEGDRVETDDMIIEVATDKIDTEIGSSHTGVITKFLVQEGDIAKIGSPICEIEVEGASKPEPYKAAALELETQIQQTVAAVAPSTDNRFYSPLVLSIAKEENISMDELEKIQGTGQNQRVTKDDILAYVKTRKITTPQFTSSSEDQIVEMDRMRKMIAQRMVDSKRISPHVTSFIETDVTQLSSWRNKVKDEFKIKYNENLTFTPLLIRAIVAAIKKYPAINAQVDGDKIIYKKDINIGMAVALPNGNLIVPVIHHADQYSLIQLSSKVNDLATRARNNQLKPEELVGGTYTMSNIGGFGNLAGTPIILQPQVAIMAFGVIRKMPAVIETEEGDFIGIRQKMIISHSYDHRVVDGSLGGLFLKEVSDYLESEQNL
ncbi:dihydrolipoamide acetyltransferase family protein [Leadbetterella byssophila]|uniref:Dihydrolipoamide acetyltransferase component of pyruvate dehydrogenase complex n=1 Tax=Leadbetterella byssophila (strain DSM 17132 / JCM 16389 / KACC 11308 / NBRC 106382 / 4M15) TaxID=649349 RepID=E4RZT6_LEAB4|nr:dihydrolipoamide acetyltransferase family protein [Leadbetterella byssophila]ADQ19228.1 catalytic domain-containing protein of components of various dehydrogenase complexes [Leadbetterella byssophila DSM 17132]